MSILDHFSDEELNSFFELNSFNKLEKRVVKKPKGINRLTQEQYQALLFEINQQLPQKKSLNFFKIILPSLGKGGMYPIYTWGILIASLQLGFLPLVVITGGIGVISLVLGGFYAYATYKKIKSQEQQKLETARLLAFKEQCANIMLARHSLIYTPKPKKAEKLNLLGYKKRSLTMFLGLATIFSESFYLGSYFILTGLGLGVGAMLGPIGFGIAAALIISVSCIISYHHYQSQKRNAQQDQAAGLKETQLNKKIKFCQNNITLDAQSETPQSSSMQTIAKSGSWENLKESCDFKVKPASVSGQGLLKFRKSPSTQSESRLSRSYGQ